MAKVPYIFYGKEQNWDSHNITFPSLIRALEGLHCKLIEFWPGEKLPSRQIHELSRGASHLILLPHMYQSLELLGRLRQERATSDIPAVIVSASQSTSAGLGLLFHRKTIKQSDVFVVPSTAERVSLSGILTGKNRVFQCPYPISRRELPKNTPVERVRRALGVGAGDRMVTYVGRLTPQKNITKLIEAVHHARLRDRALKLVLVGGFADEYCPVDGLVSRESYERAIRAKVSRLKMKSNVIFAGHVEHARALELLDVSDAAISLSTYAYDDYGRAVAEGIALGVPTVATLWGGSLDFVRVGGALGVPVRLRAGRPYVDPEEAAVALLAALASRGPRSRAAYDSYFGEQAVRRVWRQILSSTKNLRPRASEGLSMSHDTSLVMLNRINRSFEPRASDSKFAEGPLYESHRDIAFRKHVAIYSGRATER